MNKMRMNGKRIEGILLSSICLLFLFLTGCGTIEPQEGVNLILEKEGGLTVIIQTDFPPDHYDFNEFNEMNRNEVAAYNEEKGSEAVKIVSSKKEGDEISVTMHYEDVSDYCNMNHVELFSGTGKEAKDIGCRLEGEYLEASPERTKKIVKEAEVMEHRVVILNDPVTVHTYRKILYMSENVTVSDNRKMATITGEGPAIIVFK